MHVSWILSRHLCRAHVLAHARPEVFVAIDMMISFSITARRKIAFYPQYPLLAPTTLFAPSTLFHELKVQ